MTTLLRYVYDALASHIPSRFSEPAKGLKGILLKPNLYLIKLKFRQRLRFLIHFKIHIECNKEERSQYIFGFVTIKDNVCAKFIKEDKTD